MSLSSDLEIGWEEEYGLGDSSARLRALATLVPNSREFFYFNLLYLLQTAEVAPESKNQDHVIKFQTLPHLDQSFQTLLAGFKRAFPSGGSGNSPISPSLSANDIELRYLFLQYRALTTSNQVEELASVRARIASLCSIDTQIPDLPVSQFSPSQSYVAPTLPSVLDASLFDLESWKRSAISSSSSSSSSSSDFLQVHRLFSLVLTQPDFVRGLRSSVRRRLIERFPSSAPYCPDVLLDLIIKALKRSETRSESRSHSSSRSAFSLSAISHLFDKMSRSQLDRLRAEVRAAPTDETLFGAYLKKLSPPGLPSFGPELTPGEQQTMLRYLTQLLEFLETSSPKFLSTKAIVIFYLLSLYRMLGLQSSEDAQNIFTKHWITLPRAQSNSFWKLNPSTISLSSSSSSSSSRNSSRYEAEQRNRNYIPQQQQQQQQQYSPPPQQQQYSPPQQQFQSNNSMLQQLVNALPQPRLRNVLTDDDDDDLFSGRATTNVVIPFQNNSNNSNNNIAPKQTISFSVQSNLIPVGLSTFSALQESEMTRSYLLNHFFDEASGTDDPPASWTEYLRDSLLQSIRAEAYLLAGKGDPTSWIDMLDPSHSIRTLKETTVIEFDEANPRHFRPEDPVALKLWLKNVGKIVVKVFEINTDNWYRTALTEIDTSISLDGLVAPNEIMLDFSSRSPLHRFSHALDLASIPAKRGVFVVEIIGNGKSSRALIRKGQLHFRERLTFAGHAITVLDENFLPVPDVKLVLPPGRSFQQQHKQQALTDDNDDVLLRPNEILIPYLGASESTRAQSLLIQARGFTSFGSFKHRPESFSLSAGIFVNREQLLPSRRADVVIRPRVYSAGGFADAPLSLVRKASLLVSSSDQDMIPSLTDIPLDVAALLSDGVVSASFSVPPGLASLTLTLQVTLAVPSASALGAGSALSPDGATGEDAEEEVGDDGAPASSIVLCDALTLRLNQSRLSHTIFQPYFVPGESDQLRVMLLGRTGEPLPAQPVTISFSHSWFTSSRAFQLATDAEGTVNLGAVDLSKYSAITCTHNGASFQLPLLPRQQFTWPRVIHLKEDDARQRQVALPSFSGLHALICADPRTESVLQDLSSVLKFDAPSSLLRFSLDDLISSVSSPAFLAATFTLSILGCPHPIQVLIDRIDHLLDPTPEDVSPAYIADVVEVSAADKKKDPSSASSGRQLRITIVNPSPDARLHVSGSTLFPIFQLYEQLARPPALLPSSMRPARKSSSYVSGRELSDEIRYINNRKYLPVYPGAYPSIPPPSLLSVPFVHKTTSESQGFASAGNEYAAAGGSAEQTTERSSANIGPVQNLDDPSCLDFLSSEASVFVNLGLPLEKRNGHLVELFLPLPEQYNTAPTTQFQIVLTQGRHVSLRTFLLSPPPKAVELLQRHNLCLTETQALCAKKHFIETFHCEMLPPQTPFQTAKSASGHNLEYFDSLSKVFTFFMAVANNRTQLQEFHFLLKWNDLEDSQKIDYYAKFASHELNFFIFKKDPAFFASFVKPHLEHRLSSASTLIDAYLLGKLPSEPRFSSPAIVAQLNAFERILLAQQHGSLPNYLLNLGDLVQAAKNTQHERNRFLTVLAIHRMDASRLESFNEVDRPRATPKLFAAVSNAPMLGRMRRRTSISSMDDCFAPPKSSSINKHSVNKKKEACKRVFSSEDDDDDDGSFDECESLRSSARMPSKSFGKSKSISKPARLPSVVAPPSHAALQMAECRYYGSDAIYNTYGIAPNQFWLDYAQHLVKVDQSSASSTSSVGNSLPFLSAHIHHIGGQLSELLLALAVLDLPFASAVSQPVLRHHADGNIAEIRSTATPLILFQKAITEQSQGIDAQAMSKPHLMLTQNIIDPQDPTYVNEEGETVDKVLLPTDQLLPHRLYTIRVIVLNVSGTSQQLDLLYQIPVGSIAVGDTKTTHSYFLEVGPYSTRTSEMIVYFPREGTYSLFPAHVFKRGALLGYAQTSDITVVSKPTVVERTWEVIVSDRGNETEVLEFMKKASLSALNLRVLEPRIARDADFHNAVVRLLRQHFHFNASVWKYAFLHSNLPLMIELLQTLQCPGLSSALVLAGFAAPTPFSSPYEYDNLWNARTHEFGARRKLLNDELRNTYRRFLVHCCDQATLSAEDHLRATYFLIIMDRFAEALAHMTQAERLIGATTFGTPSEQNLLLAWFQCYTSLRLNHIAAAEAIAQRCAPVCSIPRLRSRFEAVLDQTALLRRLGQPGTGSPADLAAALLGGSDFVSSASMRASLQAGAQPIPSLSFLVSPNHESLRVQYEHLTDNLSVNYYSMDVELLFSTKPFLSDTANAREKGSSNFQYIQPTLSQSFALDAHATTLDIPIPQQFLHSNLMIELSANGLVVAESLYAHSLDVHIIASRGALCVLSQETHQPLSGVYVKVYARNDPVSPGSFYKDGYTDFAGRFDYAHLNSQRIDSILEFSILLISTDHGAVIHRTLAPSHSRIKRLRNN